MNHSRRLLSTAIGVLLLAACKEKGTTPPSSPPVAADAEGFTGSSSCRECHEKFYQLWAPSHHGLAMQPFTMELAKAKLTPQDQDVVVGEVRYRALIDGGKGLVVERGPAGEKRYEIAHVLGGKNVFYFLTALDRGRLQVLPVAYDVNARTWFDTALSAARDPARAREEVVHWMEPALTFNTSCFSCHVSQLQTNYDLATDTYRTVWKEPGINCETCHGPCGEHVRVFREAPKGQKPADLKLIRLKGFDTQKLNDACAPCHAKMSPITSTFRAGERFFDHFDLAGFEHADFYPDGRDLGENYTHTLWLTSPCVKSGQLGCLQCHTSSGRWRQREKPNDSCRPCHEERVADPVPHTHHAAGSPGSLCISCHMPETTFARMKRHDHSMRPPTPAATVEFGSPNACNLCHKDKDATWADGWVRKWRTRDYQAPVLARARLIDAARRRDWSALPAMLAYLKDPGRDEIFAASLVSLLRECDREAKWPAIVEALGDPSPLVRARAAEALREHLTPEALAALGKAAGDSYRLVRVRAASSLAAVPAEAIDPAARPAVERAIAELESSLRTRPDDATAYYNLGNIEMDRRRFDDAVASYQTAIRLRPEALPFHVNLGMAYGAMGDAAKAETAFRKALDREPKNAAALFNLGLLLAEQGKTTEAMESLRAALASDPQMGAAAYNLGVLLAEQNPAESLALCRKAAVLSPDNPKYAYTVAFYEQRGGDTAGAVRTLKELVRRHPDYPDGYAMLGELYEGQGRRAEALALYRRASGESALPAMARVTFQARAGTLAGSSKAPTRR